MFRRQVLNGDDARGYVVACLREVPAEPLHEVIIQEWAPPGSDRQMNSIYMRYAEIAKQLPEDDAHGWRRFCKLNIGVPILREDPDVSRRIGDVLDHLPYETQLEAMDMIDVVSVMGRKQRSRYFKEIEQHPKFRGLRFTDPDPRKRKR